MKKSLSSFRFSNIFDHKPSTFLGLSVALLLIIPIFFGFWQMSDVSVLLSGVVPFLLYGPEKTDDNEDGIARGKTAALAITVALFVFASCTPQQKLQTLLKRHPELATKDAVIVRDTAVTKRVYGDTAFVFSASKDTVTILKENLSVKYFYNKDTIFLSGEVKPDTITRVKTIIYYRIKHTPPPSRKEKWYENRWFLLLAGFAGCVGILALGRGRL